MPSRNHQLLRARIEELRRHLLPDPFEATGAYGDDVGVGIKTLAFRVLTHAEIESYFEDRVIEIAKAAWSLWQSCQLASRPALSLLAFSGHEMKLPPDTLEAPGENQKKAWPDTLDIQRRLQLAVSTYIYRVSKENHGIREKNILSMLLPIGFDHSCIDAITVADIDDFGRRRGEAAHSSSAPQVQQGIDPKDEYDRIQAMISNIEPIDDELDRLLAQVVPENVVSDQVSKS